MTTTEITDVIHKKLDLYEEIINKLDELTSIRLEAIRQSQIIAALIMEHGGLISQLNWAKAHGRPDAFISHTFSVSNYGVEIRTAIK